MSEIPSWERLRNLGTGALPSIEDMEGWAHMLLASVGLAGAINPLPSEILASLLRQERIILYGTAPKVAGGWHYLYGIYVDPDTPEAELEAVIGHELWHWWMTTMGVMCVLQEHLADQFNACVLIPRHAIYQLTSREVGGFACGIQTLLDTYAHVATPSEILVRAAMVCKVGLVVFDAQGERVPVGDGLYPVNLRMGREGERAAVGRALVAVGPVHLHSLEFEFADVVAVAFFARDRSWVAIVATPPTEEALVMGW